MINTDKILPKLIDHFYDIDVNVKDDIIGCRYIRTSSKIIYGSREDIDKYFIDIIATMCTSENWIFAYVIVFFSPAAGNICFFIFRHLKMTFLIQTPTFWMKYLPDECTDCPEMEICGGGCPLNYSAPTTVCRESFS